MTVSKRIHLPWLHEIHDKLTHDQITYDDACSEAIYEENEELVTRKINKRTLKRAFEINNMPIPEKKPGRAKKQIPEAAFKQIDSIRSKITLGVSKTYERIIADADLEDPSISFRAVYSAFQDMEILEYTMKPEPVKKFTTRYESEKCDGIWHTDIHFFSETRSPIIVYLDDKSRYIVSWSQLENKSSEQTKQSLEKAIRNGRAPGVIWTDCGSEFRGQFETYLMENNIQHQTTEPNSPQQNGKIERFWRELEKNCDTINEIEPYIYEYNKTPHWGLEKIGKRHFTPKEVYQKGPNWNLGEPVVWFVNGEMKILRE